MSNAQTIASLEEAAADIGEKLAHEEIRTGEALRSVLIETMKRFDVNTIGPVRIAVRQYLAKYDASQLPKNEAVTIVMRRN